MNILIIGGGELGTALMKILSSSERRIFVWDKIKERNLSSKKLSELLPEIEVILLAPPARAIKSICFEITDFRGLVICFSKGIDLDNNARMDEILERYFVNYALCSGPMLAEELMSGGNGAGVIALKNSEDLSLVKKIFLNSSLTIEYSNDLRGVALGGILKNIYAILAGGMIGLKWSSNYRSFLLAQAIKEVRDIITELGGQEESFWLSSGLADFLATVNSNYSSNYNFGYEVITKGFSNKEPEGLYSYKYIVSLVGDIDNYPLLGLAGCLLDKRDKSQSDFEDYRDNLNNNH